MVCAPAASPTACRWAANSNTWTAGRCRMRSGRAARCLEGQGNEGNERNEGNGRAMSAVATAQDLEVSQLPHTTTGPQDRKIAVAGKSVSDRVDLGGRLT